MLKMVVSCPNTAVLLETIKAKRASSSDAQILAQLHLQASAQLKAREMTQAIHEESRSALASLIVWIL